MSTVVKDRAISPPAKIILGVSGSIAAFKAVSLASDLVATGHDVRVVLTAGGEHFVAPLSFEAITGNSVAIDVWDEQPGQSRMGHLELARWADVFVVAPASAGVLARLALGLADDMLTATALACRAPLVVAPAMETAMWQHPATTEHIRTLTRRGATIVGPEAGRLATGAEGEGRMAEPATIFEAIEQTLRGQADLAGLRVLVTAGPTIEPVDPVRFLGNRSSGKMGYAIAQEARDRGADVLLVTGRTALTDPHGIELIRVETTAEMRHAVLEHVRGRDVVVMAAAIADFRPAAAAERKIKRADRLTLELVPTEDIAAEAAQAAPRALHVGFALESGNLVGAAREKLRRKGQHLVIANRISAQENPFGSDENRVAFVSEESAMEYPTMSKREVARLMWDEVGRMLGRLP